MSSGGQLAEVISAVVAAAGAISAALAAQKATKPGTLKAAAGGVDTRIRRELLDQHREWDASAYAALQANRIAFRSPPDLRNLL